MKIEKRLMLNKKETKFNGYCPSRWTPQNRKEVKVVLGTHISIVNGSLDILTIVTFPFLFGLSKTNVATNWPKRLFDWTLNTNDKLLPPGWQKDIWSEDSLFQKRLTAPRRRRVERLKTTYKFVCTVAPPLFKTVSSISSDRSSLCYQQNLIMSTRQDWREHDQIAMFSTYDWQCIGASKLIRATLVAFGQFHQLDPIGLKAFDKGAVSSSCSTVKVIRAAEPICFMAASSRARSLVRATLIALGRFDQLGPFGLNLKTTGHCY